MITFVLEIMDCVESISGRMEFMLINYIDNLKPLVEKNKKINSFKFEKNTTKYILNSKEYKKEMQKNSQMVLIAKVHMHAFVRKRKIKHFVFIKNSYFTFEFYVNNLSDEISYLYESTKVALKKISQKTYLEKCLDKSIQQFKRNIK